MKSTLEGYCTWLTWPQVQFSSQAWIVGLETMSTKYIANLSWTPLNRLWMKLFAFCENLFRTYSVPLFYRQRRRSKTPSYFYSKLVGEGGEPNNLTRWGPLGGNLTFDPVRLLLTKKVFMPWTTISIREINANIKFFKLEMIIQKKNEIFIAGQFHFNKIIIQCNNIIMKDE